ncbi:MAG: hypothetical protein EXS35_17505 [Pedosphaera sp.]|nr:hypothetical protein [Pedosphaera sp.]
MAAVAELGSLGQSMRLSEKLLLGITPLFPLGVILLSKGQLFLGLPSRLLLGLLWLCAGVTLIVLGSMHYSATSFRGWILIGSGFLHILLLFLLPALVHILGYD